jgi:hypothetical protein
MRAMKLGCSVGVIQMALNQGDYWMRGAVTTGVVIKTIMTPLVTFAVSLYAAAETKVEQLKNDQMETNNE